MTAQLTLTYDGNALVPLNRRLADEQLVVGQKYTARAVGERSRETHNHFFALVQIAYDNLPEHMSDAWPSPDHLRKWALCKAGHCSTHVIVGKAGAVARTMALDDYTIIVCQDDVITAYTAQSQSRKAMGRDLFQRSKEDVLRVLSELIGVDVTELKKAEAA